MGTNYYTAKKCPECGTMHNEIHLGKSSYGWAFSFQWNDGRYYKSYDEMLKWLKDKEIYTECQDRVSIEEFMQMIESKKGGMSHALKHSSAKGFMIDGHSFINCEFS
jgi:ssDNA-binding Zn-finger/Zn-ribbon topoisomerase 1